MVGQSGLVYGCSLLISFFRIPVVLSFETALGGYARHRSEFVGSCGEARRCRFSNNNVSSVPINAVSKRPEREKKS
jgi:hypothetical protein